MLEPWRAFALRYGARGRTKAQIQPAKEGVLESECERAARRELRRRRFKCIPVSGAGIGRRLYASLMRYIGQLLRLHWRGQPNRSDGGGLVVDLAA